MRYFGGLLLVGLVLCLAPGVSAEAEEPDATETRAAIRKAIPLLERGAHESAEQRQCFTCHNQALPVLALAEARRRGFSVDEANLQRQIQHTADHLTRGLKDYKEGRGQGGRSLTAGYALWTLDAGARQRDSTTDAVVSYLVDHQKDDIHWRHRGSRPPSSGSDFTATYVALRGVKSFGSEESLGRADQRIRSATKWLLDEKPRDTEDRVFRLRALHLVDADTSELNRAADELVSQQRDDGGWAQMEDMDSDAYATATVLATLLDVRQLPDAAIERGLRYLIATQLEDGSWHVATRADPFQTYYESGFPHAEDQFISISASAWATLALLLSIPESEPTVAEQPSSG